PAAKTGSEPGEAGGPVVAYRCESAATQGRCRARSQRSKVIEAAIREQLRDATARHPVAARPATPPDVTARSRRLERRLVASIERWIAGEWRYDELVRRVPSLVGELQAIEEPDSAAAIA